MQLLVRHRRPALLGVLAAVLVPLAPPSALAHHAASPLVVPVGEDGVTYRLPQGEDDGEPLGPPTLAVSPQGVVWIDDVYGDRLLRYAADGTRLAPIDVDALGMESAVDVAVDADDVYVLDVYPLTGRYRVWHLTHDGQVVAFHDVPEGYWLEDGLTGVTVDGDGSVLVELSGGYRLVQLLDAEGRERLAERDGHTAHGRHYDVEYSDTFFGPVTVVAGDVRVEIDTDHGNGAAHFLGATPDGDFFVAVEEVDLSDGPVQVDLTVRRYSKDGRLVSAARRELRPTQFTHVDRPFALHGDRVYELSTAQDHVTVAPMQFAPILQAKLGAVPVRRQTAVDAVDAALVLSRAAFPGGAQTALLGRDDDFADGLAAGGTQGKLAAPLLLTPGDRLDADVAREIARLGVTRVHLLGGTAALSSDVERALQASGITTGRWSGRDRVETAAAVAAASFPTAPVAVLARGFAGAEPTQGFADALAVGAWAAERRWPTLLTRTDRLPTAVADYLRAAGTRQVYVVGGTAAVSDAVVADLKRLGVAVTRVAGADRAATAVAIARQRAAATADAVDEVLLLDGSAPGAWAPGVASAAYAGRSGAQVVLGAGDSLPGATRQWLQGASSPRPLLCGPLTSRTTCDLAAQALGHATD